MRRIFFNYQHAYASKYFTIYVPLRLRRWGYNREAIRSDQRLTLETSTS